MITKTQAYIEAGIWYRHCCVCNKLQPIFSDREDIESWNEYQPNYIDQLRKRGIGITSGYCPDHLPLINKRENGI